MSKKWRVVRSGTKWKLITGAGDFIDKDFDGLTALANLHNSQVADARVETRHQSAKAKKLR